MAMKSSIFWEIIRLKSTDFSEENITSIFSVEE
jgi:hypothetical protein